MAILVLFGVYYIYIVMRPSSVFFLNFESFLSKGKGIRVLNFSNYFMKISLYSIV